ncbi:delta and Notch-like epidermal growth factor-related receptor isoform X3 [Patagioenas fasciata]|uniref:delta and Notch-like epidermal growth factor-related receptor isoform X3 n=1 Tax=Patagioenas fasciata TaxID=372321 RepID=UPI003A9912B4
MPRAAPLLLLLLALAQRRACLPGPATAAPSGRDPCLSQPCRNNGTCSPVPARGLAAPRRLQLLPPQPPGAYSCACPAGVTGTYCQFVSDPCASNPCHHGNCSTSGDGYLCLCSQGYEGTNCERSIHNLPVSERTEPMSPRQSRPVSTTVEPDIVLPRSRATVMLPTWQPKAGQKVVDLKWDEIEITPDVACGNASSNTSAGGRLISFEVPQNTSIKIRQDATASLILLWKVTTTGFKQCSLIDGRSVTLLQALGGLVLSEEMLALGNNYFIGFLNDSVTKCIVALRLTVIVKVSTCMPVGSHSDNFQCSGKGKCITKADEATFFCECEDEFRGSQCEEFDACQSQPCQNNATCTDVVQKHDGNNFTCSCLTGYTGELCQSEVDHCIQQPCQNGGTCSSSINGFSCQCPEGYHGLYCEEEYNECLSAPCQNGATCRDLVNGYECVCLAEYEGRHCELYKDPCVNINCQNGGTCDSEGLNATCICSPGYTGEECEIDVNDCDSNPCHHAGTCIDQPGGYTCHCPHGWVGANCEIPDLQWKSGHMAESLTNMPRHSLYIIIGALCVAFVLMLIILIVGICRISRIEYQGSSRPAYEEFYNCRSIDSEFSNAIASIRHARFGKKSRPAMYDATPIAYEDYSPDDKPLVTLIKTKDL